MGERTPVSSTQMGARPLAPKTAASLVRSSTSLREKPAAALGTQAADGSAARKGVGEHLELHVLDQVGPTSTISMPKRTSGLSLP